MAVQLSETWRRAGCSSASGRQVSVQAAVVRMDASVMEAESNLSSKDPLRMDELSG